MAVVLDGQIVWSCVRDKDGERTYKIKWQVAVGAGEGPASALTAPGIPLPGTVWAFDDDLDSWAFCQKDATVTMVVERENLYFFVEQTFSTKAGKRCQDEQIEDPLLKQPIISGSFVKYTREATDDRNDDPLQNSAFEQFRGPQVEFDFNRPTVKIQQNVADLQLPLLNQMIDTVNDAPLWGCDARTIKLSSISWERKFYGSCEIYYDRTLEFDISDEFDRDILDEGTKVLNGRWEHNDPALVGPPEPPGWYLVAINGDRPDETDPSHYIKFKDRKNENARVVLDGKDLDPEFGVPGLGTPLGADVYDIDGSLLIGHRDEPSNVHVEVYDESNFLELGIPTSF